MMLFVTGGSRGIGAAIVLHAARCGHDVAFTYLAKSEVAQDVVRQAQALCPSGRYKAYQLDVGRAADVDVVGTRVLADFDNVDAVVVNAGVHRNNLLLAMSDEDWQAVINTNLNGAFYVCRFFLTTFLANGFGRFILVGSLGARGVSGQGNYAASKAGMLGLSSTLAKEYGKKGITSNVISPGLIDTDMMRAATPDQNRQFWEHYCPVGRLGRSEEVAELVTFLTTPGAAFINGQELRIDGGLDWAP
jgi:NAD(P)-dependent dehydrogenase (short-subunit alcohol dehydrogenase family)